MARLLPQSAVIEVWPAVSDNFARPAVGLCWLVPDELSFSFGGAVNLAKCFAPTALQNLILGALVLSLAMTVLVPAWPP